MNRTHLLLFFVILIQLCIVGCGKKKSPSAGLILKDTVELRENKPKIVTDTPYSDSLGEADLNKLMDIINNHTSNPSLQTAWHITGNHIEVRLIYHSEKNINRFKEEVVNHPAIQFPERKPLNLPLPDDDNNYDIQVYLSPRTFKDSISNTTMVMTNYSGREIITGFRYAIFKHTGEKWQHIPFSFSTIDLGVLIPPGKSYEFDIRLFSDAYDYSPGRYLVTKDFSFTENNSTYTPHIVGAEFTVE